MCYPNISNAVRGLFDTIPKNDLAVPKRSCTGGGVTQPCISIRRRHFGSCERGKGKEESVVRRHRKWGSGCERGCNIDRSCLIFLRFLQYPLLRHRGLCFWVPLCVSRPSTDLARNVFSVLGVLMNGPREHRTELLHFVM
jgi:hypothetical protein